jgi:hypothetical protein
MKKGVTTAQFASATDAETAAAAAMDVKDSDVTSLIPDIDTAAVATVMDVDGSGAATSDNGTASSDASSTGSAAKPNAVDATATSAGATASPLGEVAAKGTKQATASPEGTLFQRLLYVISRIGRCWAYDIGLLLQLRHSCPLSTRPRQ